MKTRWDVKRWAAPAAALCIIVVGLALPRHGRSDSTATVDVGAAVPPQLLAGGGDVGSAAPKLAPAAGDVVVYVCGAVKNPGVYRLHATDRVIAAIAKAGGTRSSADLEQVNLAEPLSDAMKIDVPAKNVVAGIYSGARSGNVAARIHSRGLPHSHGRGLGPAGSGRSNHGKLQPGQTLDVNSATADNLVRLPGVGPGLAQRIVAYREEYGPFQTVDDLQNVSGIGPSKFERLAPYVRL